MKAFEIYVSEHGDFTAEKTIFLKEGFSIWAAAFKPFWALYNKIWSVSAILFILITIPIYLENIGIVNKVSAQILQIGIFFFAGFNATDWKGKNLQSKGYKFFGVVNAKNELEAKQRFFSTYVK